MYPPDTHIINVHSYLEEIVHSYFKINTIDLPRAVTLKKRKSSPPSEYEYLENKNIDRTGHLYSDWLIYQAKKRIVVYWEMDFLGVPHSSEQMIMS